MASFLYPIYKYLCIALKPVWEAVDVLCPSNMLGSKFNGSFCSEQIYIYTCTIHIIHSTRIFVLHAFVDNIVTCFISQHCLGIWPGSCGTTSKFPLWRYSSRRADSGFCEFKQCFNAAHHYSLETLREAS